MENDKTLPTNVKEESSTNAELSEARRIPKPLYQEREERSENRKEKDRSEGRVKESTYHSLFNDLKLNTAVKLTLRNARIVDKNTFNDKTLTSISEIPKYIVEKLMILDSPARAFKLNQANITHNFDDKDDDKIYKEVNETVNPMDAFLAVFHCSDDFLRQNLAIKLSACQLSVPFLLPDPIQPSEKITMLMWALEGIKKSWKAASNSNEQTKARHVFALEHPFPIVSFIRIGETAFSKSELINKLMSDGNKGDRDYFFHKDCKGGGVERRIVDGLVELFWYLPGDRKSEGFPQEICFANLRGDARNFKKQLKVLAKISSVMCLLLTSKCPDKSTKEVLTEAAKSKTLFLVFNDKPVEDSKKYFDDLKQNHHGKLFSIHRKTHANKYDFLETIRQGIQNNAYTSTAEPLKMISSYAKECEITVDKELDIGNNYHWRERVNYWMMKGPRNAKMELKLQTQVPTLASLEREKFCPKPQGGKTENEHIDNIHSKMEETKKLQKESYTKMDRQICECLNRLTEMKNVELDYALAILKRDLDKMSLKVLVSLQAKYCDAWLDIQRKKKQQKQDGSDISLSAEKQRLKQLEKLIRESSFGLEHIIREIAQIHQLVKTGDLDCNYGHANAAADVLLSGHLLELMDGDSSYIPFEWFNAVFKSLAQKTNEAKIFVISVLGIQSSGKSTMLNTMFGLAFPVSAGKCTRGAFASLIPISDSLKTASEVDYILIIDTEGLRGSGDSVERQHDNELATFVVGVADLTIVNIFGENYNEMKQFLEIVMHAFLKMKLVKEKRICQIVHQCVAAVGASDSLAAERIALKKNLDEKVKFAAIQEACDDEFQELNDILSFDENEDVFYIPNLFQGSPPMAPVDLDYGRAVQKVREKIISLMCLPERSHQSISQFRERVCDLWKAILRENFIFSFRNTIEVRAYTSLDQKYFEESVKTMVTGMAELEKRIQVSLMRSSVNILDDGWSVWKNEIRKTAEELEKKMRGAMEEFFETNEDKATLEQWKDHILSRITLLRDVQETEVSKNCLAALKYWQRRQEIDEKKLTCKKELLSKARKFITSVEDTNDEEKCKLKFEQEWKQWIKCVPRCSEKEFDVNDEMLKVLFYTNKKLTVEMKDKFHGHNNVSDFQNTFPYLMQVCQKDHQLSMEAEWAQEQAVNAAVQFAKTTLGSGVRCRSDDLRRMYHLVTSTIQENKQKQSLKFPNFDSLVCDTLLCSFADTYDDFCEMEKRYIRERNIRQDLEKNLRPKLEKYFLNMCKQMRNEVLAATSMVDVLQKAIESKLNKNMCQAVAREIFKNADFQSKGQFHASVLIKLGEEGMFESYIRYLRNPVKFLRGMFISAIKNYCLANTDDSIALLLENEVSKIKDEVLAAISTASCQAKSTNTAFTNWLETFVKECSILEITTDMFDVAAIDDELKNFEIFEDRVLQNVNEFCQSLVSAGINVHVYEKWNPAPHQLLLDLMFGCQERCPFCKGLCDHTVRDHAGEHSTRIHRPRGIAGCHNVDSHILSSRNCTALVASSSNFRSTVTSHEWHPYKDYRTVNEYYKSWSIPSDKSFEVSTYWKWFMASFSKQLADYYKQKEPEIPKAWKSITFEKAKQHIREEYKLSY